MYYPKIKGERIYLSPVNPEDCEAYTYWINDPRVSDGLGLTDKVVSLESERKILERMANAQDEYNFAIVRREDDMLLGNCSIHAIKQASRTAMVGLFIGEAENRGQGYGTETLRLLLHYAYKTLNLHNISLNVFAFNERAIACYERVGFREIGRRRESYFAHGRFYDEIMMDILSTEFE